jgi:amino acid adenylation domain-containing protein
MVRRFPSAGPGLLRHHINPCQEKSPRQYYLTLHNGAALRMTKSRNLQIHPRTMLPFPTQKIQAAPETSRPSIPRRPPGVPVPLSLAQEQVWLHAQLALATPLYNQVLALRHTGPLNQEALERSLDEIVRRHEALRTTFPLMDGVPHQVIREHQALELAVVDLTAFQDGRCHTEVLRAATELVRRPFDFAEGPLLRACLLRLSYVDHILVVACHALAADEWSLGLMVGELSVLYDAFAANQPASLPDLPIQYADYSQWQTSRWTGSELDQHAAWWKEHLAGVQSVLELPADRPRPPVQVFSGSQRSLLLSKQLAESANRLAEQESVSLFVVLMSAFQVLLGRYSGQEEMISGSVMSGRERAESHDLLGPFANTLLIRANLAGDLTFRQLLHRVHHAVESAREHQDVPFNRLVSELQPERDPSRNPLFQVLFSLEPSVSLPGSAWELMDLDVDTGTAKVDLQLQLWEKSEGLNARFTYNSDLFEAATILRMANHFETLLRGAVANADQLVSQLPLLSAEEQHQLLVEWNDTRTDYPKDLCIHQLFEAQVERTPDATAVVFEGERLTYRELNARANQLAHYLRRLGVGPDVLVGICMERSLEMVVAILGILKAGGAYLPLDPDNPKGRLQSILADAGSPIVITLKRLAGWLPGGKFRVLCLDSGWPTFAQEDHKNLMARSNPEHCAYVIFTSGSTGKPKGVLIPHRAIVNHMLWMRDAFRPGPGDNILQRTPYSFDASVWEFFLPLVSGATLTIARPGGHIRAAYLVDLIARERVTIIQFVPSILRLFLEADSVEKCSCLRAVFCGGEVLAPDLQSLFFGRLNCELYNLYGPTECTIDSTFWKCQNEWDRPIVPIGRPIANLKAYLLDRESQLVPIGVVGELHIAGAGLGRGYLNRPKLTRERFISDPFSPSPGACMYKTGDLARFLPTGDIECLGRSDHQVKIHGLRIELGEIEAAIREHPDVRQNVVMAQETSSGEKRLIAYLVLRSGAKFDKVQLRSYLREMLPDYMVPSAIVTLAGLPLTPNGKVDRRALPPPERLDTRGSGDFVAPRDAVESQLVRIWEDVLHAHPISVTHDFFELGGHSLLAARLMDRIEQAFGKRLPLAMLFQARTVEQLGAALRDESLSPSWSSLVPIQTGGNRPPFFCIHGIGGNVVGFYDLARALGPDQPVYGLQAQGLDGKTPPHTRVEEMAAHYIDEIRCVQPEGPYFLGGLSFGGAVAFEMARQLQAEGQQVGLLALFATFPGTPTPRLALLLKFLRLPLGRKFAYVAWKLRVGKRVIERLSLPPTLKAVRAAHRVANGRYAMQRYDGRVTLFAPSDLSLRGAEDPRAAWKEFASDVEVQEAPGDHHTMLDEPYVRVLAERLHDCLERPYPELAARASAMISNSM